MKRPIHTTIITILLLLITSIGYALDVRDFSYSHLSKANGMDNQRVFSICEAENGAIWWSTKSSVGRYNGSVVKVYPLDKQTPYRHQGGRVINLSLGKDTLYAFDNNGTLYYFNAIHDDFEIRASLSEMMKHDVALNDVYATDEGLYLAMYDGVYLLNGDHVTLLFKSAYVNRIVPMKHHLLFCTRDGLYDRKGRRLLPYNVESGYFDELSDKLWLGSYENGLDIVSMSDDGQVLRDDCVSLEGYTRQNPIRSICPYDDETMLIGIDGQGVYQMNRNGSGQASLLFDANESAHGVIHGNGVYSIWVDRWKNIVIGTYSGGIDIARPIGSTTAVYNHIPNNRQTLLNDHVNMVMPLSEDLLLMGTDNGISILNTKTGIWQHGCQGTVVLHACRKPDGGVLVSTYGKGIYDIGQHADVRQVYTTADGMLKDDHVYTTFFDRDGSLWVGTLNGDLLQKKGTELIYYPIHDVQSITQLASGQIAVGTAFGLKLITPENGRVRELNYAPSGVTDINPFVNHLMAHGLELWIATDGGGIYIYHQAERECRQITKKDGLPSNHVSSLITGKDGRIWIATENGLAYISPDEPSKIVNVNYCYGLDREYVRGAVANLSGGDIIFGTTTGAVIIHPADVQPLNYTAHLQFLDVDAVAHQDDGFNEEVHRMLASGELKLSYRQRTFNLYFESVNMRNHFDIVYRYRVGKGEWSQPSDQQYIRFTNLESGEHLLTLQCVSRTSGVVIDTAKLTIVISQPWWNSWWMWVVYICLIALLFYGAWRVYELHEKYMRLTIDHLQVATSPQASDNEPSVDDKAGDSGKDFIDKVTMLVAEHLGDSQFSIDQLCREMAMSRTLFYVKLKSYTGKSPQDFIRIVRLEHAASMLRNGRSVTDASALAGFDNPKYFSTVFKKYFGVSPSKYQ